MKGTPIQPGDIFVRQYGDTELIHLYLWRYTGSAKQPYIRLTGKGGDSTWNTTREEVERRPHRQGHTWRYVGTVPLDAIEELMERGTYRA